MIPSLHAPSLIICLCPALSSHLLLAVEGIGDRANATKRKGMDNDDGHEDVDEEGNRENVDIETLVMW
eukprot:4613241-Pyramimonas_sp.AAC.1